MQQLTPIRTLHPSSHFYAAIVGFILGIVITVTFQLQLFVSPLWIFLAVSLLLFSLTRPIILTLLAALLSGFILAGVRTAPRLADAAYLSAFVNYNITISGKIIDDPDSSSGSTVLHLQDLQVYPSGTTSTVPSGPLDTAVGTPINTQAHAHIDTSIQTHAGTDTDTLTRTSTDPDTQALARTTVDTPTRALAGTLYVKLSSAPPDLERSDYLTLSGKLSSGFGTFIGSLSRPEILRLNRSEPGDLPARAKRAFAAAVRTYVPEPESNLGLAYLVGDKSGLSSDFSDALRAVGMTHVVVASGAHLGILVNLIKKLFGRISRFAGLLFSLLAILGFALIVGFTPSMTRAALVAILSLLVGYAGRQFTPVRLLLFVGAITLFIAPENFLHLGWQLSFASFFGILVVAPRLTHFLYGGKHPSWLAEMLLTSLSTMLVCAPILLYSFGTLSLLCFVANLIILPTLPYAMLLTFLSGLAAFCAPVASASALSVFPALANQSMLSTLPISSILPTLSTASILSTFSTHSMLSTPASLLAPLSGLFQLLAQLIAGATTLLLRLHIWLVDFLQEKSIFILELEPNNPLYFLGYLPLLAGLIYLQIFHNVPRQQLIQSQDRTQPTDRQNRHKNQPNSQIKANKD